MVPNQLLSTLGNVLHSACYGALNALHALVHLLDGWTRDVAGDPRHHVYEFRAEAFGLGSGHAEGRQLLLARGRGGGRRRIRLALLRGSEQLVDGLLLLREDAPILGGLGVVLSLKHAEAVLKLGVGGGRGRRLRIRRGSLRERLRIRHAGYARGRDARGRGAPAIEVDLLADHGELRLVAQSRLRGRRRRSGGRSGLRL